MQSLGVIVEYNPFHNGHLFHLEQSKHTTDPDVVIAVMSGQFLQRGEPALVSKWTRTKMALTNGVDIVVELPYAFATQKAEVFANGSISILSALKCTNVCFGSEQGNIGDFERTTIIMEEQKPLYDLLVKEFINKGYSFPKASSLAFQQLMDGRENVLDLTKPNNILGYHYVKSIREQKSEISAFTIGRTNAGYHDPEFNDSPIASATSIRKHLFDHDGDIEKVQRFVPKPTYELLNRYIKQTGSFHQWEDYFSLLKFRILCSTSSELSEIYEVEEGIEHRLQQIIKESHSFLEFMTKLKTKRYTWTRLQRICTHILTNTKKETMHRVMTQSHSEYVRLLGMSRKGQAYLREIKKELEIPLLSKISGFDSQMLEMDVRATNTYAMKFSEPTRSNWMLQEFSKPPIRFDEVENKFL
ncbi:nucleotidyltransferase [Sutcliffiella rhizosphaerae]|uniref:tRNA(Met) cytidine acetate ligase n=1 Tax=Sutcliffiella rhizosphaerae TaxID=2880967 RepID=A0ABN8AAW7_9BACI|nr:nucleotidyltransferase [Sutcliffiella rhizosphaerae]CAG9619825.1 tRNA(Met) cytidine acetate ligase [Sutcliffiella rhizosphaerae]